VLYCERCRKLFEDNEANRAGKCPVCRKARLRGPADNDPVFILSHNAFMSPGIEDILKRNGIPCIMQGEVGGGILYLGYAFEFFRFYVPYGAYDKSRELLADYLEGAPEEPEAEPEGERADE